MTKWSVWAIINPTIETTRVVLDLVDVSLNPAQVTCICGFLNCFSQFILTLQAKPGYYT